MSHIESHDPLLPRNSEREALLARRQARAQELGYSSPDERSRVQAGSLGGAVAALLDGFGAEWMDEYGNAYLFVPGRTTAIIDRRSGERVSFAEADYAEFNEVDPRYADMVLIRKVEAAARRLCDRSMPVHELREAIRSLLNVTRLAERNRVEVTIGKPRPASWA